MDNFPEEEDNDIERIIEEREDDVAGDHQGEGGNEDDNNEKEEEENKKKVKPKRHIANPRLKLDPPRLTGPRGLGVIESAFKDFKFKGKGHEASDLRRLMMILEHWAHRLFPKMTFQDCINRIEELGSTKAIANYVNRLRLGMECDPIVTSLTSENVREEEADPFDALVANLPKQPAPLTDEQRARMMRNRLIAEERRMARMKALQEAREKSQNNDVSETNQDQPQLSIETVVN